MITRLVIIAVAPGIGLAIALYLNDRRDREPLSLLVKTFLLGGAAILPALLVERLLLRLNFFTGLLGIAFTAFIVAGLTEEFLKRAVVLYVPFKSGHFNEKLDGIIYCAFSALGFATIENIMYVLSNYTGNYYVGIMRGILSVPAHMLFAVTMGYYLSLAKYTENPAEKRQYMARSLYIPVYLHGLFNFILMANIPILMAVFIPYVGYLWFTSVMRLREFTRFSREKPPHFEEEP